MTAIRDFSKKLNDISAQIRVAEETLVKKCNLAEATFEDLSWKAGDAGRLRIHMKGKPLIEAKIADRLAGIKQIPGLIDACGAAMEKLIAEARRPRLIF